jgi:hypothetical protein
MEKLRIAEKNKISTEIKTLNASIARSKATIERFKSQDKSSFNSAQIIKLTDKIKNDEDLLITLNQNIKKIDSGDYDSIINEEIAKNTKRNQKNNENADRKTKEKNEKKIEEKEKLDSFYKNQRSNGEISKYSLDKEKDKYLNNIVNIPDYIITNLKDMPSNKGYIWKGIWCFGEIKSKSQYPQILFEKNRGGNMLIHEINETHHCIFEKIGKNNKTLKSKVERNVVF